jgi:hypothetical protein
MVPWPVMMPATHIAWSPNFFLLEFNFPSINKVKLTKKMAEMKAIHTCSISELKSFSINKL